MTASTRQSLRVGQSRGKTIRHDSRATLQPESGDAGGAHARSKFSPDDSRGDTAPAGKADLAGRAMSADVTVRVRLERALARSVMKPLSGAALAPRFLGVSPLRKNRRLTPPRSETSHFVPRELSPPNQRTPSGLPAGGVGRRTSGCHSWRSASIGSILAAAWAG